jgi:hypothetical protein
MEQQAHTHDLLVHRSSVASGDRIDHHWLLTEGKGGLSHLHSNKQHRERVGNDQTRWGSEEDGAPSQELTG